MLIILSGIESTNKRVLSKLITEKLNKIEIDGYSIDTSTTPWSAFDKNGTLVYGPQGEDFILSLIHNEDKLANEEGLSTLHKIEAFKFSLQQEIERNCHYRHIFGRISGDFGLVPTRDISVVAQPMPSETGETIIVDYSLALERYNNRITDIQVISGIFSKMFIDKIKQDIGSENVKVLNVIRNPSVAFLMNQRDEEYYTRQRPSMKYIANQTNEDIEQMNSALSNFTVEIVDAETEKRQLKRSLFNNCSLYRFDDITTIRFEELITAGKLTINDVEINLPQDIYKPYNDYITEWEFNNSIPQNLAGPGEINDINDQYQNITTELIDPNPIPDFFKFLDYTPLDYQTIIAPKA